MGWKYEVETYWYEDDKWVSSYQGNSVIEAVRTLLKAKKFYPGRAYRLVVR